MKILSDNEINYVCEKVVDYCYNYNYETYLSMKTMYNLGCREGEVTQLNRWQLNNKGTMLLRTIKRGGFRTILWDEIPAGFLNAIQFQDERTFIKSARNLRWSFDKFSPYAQLFTMKKGISCHLFRHNKVKQLVNSGSSLLDVMNYLAVSSIDVPDYYYKSIIYSNA